MGISRYSVFVLLAVFFGVLLLVFGRNTFREVSRWLLWVVSAISVCVGAAVFLAAEGKPLAILGGVALWLFAAYTIAVARSQRVRS